MKNRSKQTQERSLSEISNLSSFVWSLCFGYYRESDLQIFVNYLKEISLTYLRYQSTCGKQVSWKGHNYSGELDDLALDCVAGLFTRNEKGEFVQLKKYFAQSSDPRDLDEQETVCLLKRLVIKKTKQELTRIYKERDPQGAKIVRNMKIAVKTTSDISSFKKMGKEYIYATNGRNESVDFEETPQVSIPHNGGSDITSSVENESDVPSNIENKKCIPESYLRAEYMRYFRPHEPVTTCIRKMLKIVNDDNRFEKVLPFDMAARVLQQSAKQITHEWLTSSIVSSSPLDDFGLIEIAKRRLTVQNKMRKKIQKDYVQTHKISESKGDTYIKALGDLLDDVSEGRELLSHYSYLKRYLPELSQSAYRTQERTIFEYLAKIAKKWFRIALRDLL